MREKVALAISLIFFGFFYLLADMAAGALGAPTYIDGVSTGVGLCIMVSSILLAWRVFHWVLSGKVHGNIRKDSHITWLFWLLSMLAFIFSVAIIRNIELSSTIQRMAVLGCAIFIAWLAYTKHTETMRKFRSDSSDHA